MLACQPLNVTEETEDKNSKRRNTKMVTLKICIVAAVSLLCVYGLPNPPLARNTIFMDEKLEGQIFENIDEYEILANNATVLNYRLPTTTKPIHYNILWVVDIARLCFTGVVDIQLAATQPNVDEIVIHSHDLTLTSVVLRQGETVIPQTNDINTELQFLKVSLANGTLLYNAASPIVYTLSIEFNADLRNDMFGMYKTWFKNNPNQISLSWIASTQFQATSARFAFPCYDEPSFKATFDVTIRRPTTHRSWFCTRLSESRNTTVQGYEEDVYTRTPIMSTYLLALVVAEYKSLYDTESANFKYEIIARPSAIAENQAAYAMDLGKRLVDIMNNHTGIDYVSMNPNLKMTHAAIADFQVGGMENWGLIIYREAYLMYHPDHTNDYFKQLIAYYFSHEIAHMWFGNLVTCEFWDNLWLNEGFATYYLYYLTDLAEDYMGFKTRFINELVHTALLFDSTESAHPLHNPNLGPDSIKYMFSAISYNKGAAIIRMTEHLLGTDVYTQGLQNYLVQRSFKVANPTHIFQALEAAGIAAGALSQYGNFSLMDYSRSWVDQSGHPILNVQVNHQTGDMTVSQRRFSINTGYSNANLIYIIPITFATAANPDFNNLKPSHIISSTVSVINRGSTGDQWVIFNKQQSGYYRVNYDEYTWNLIIMTLRGPNRTLIHEYNRAQIVDDVFQFARAGLMSYKRAFNILSFLENETEYAPWVAAITGFNWLRNRLAGTAYQTQLEAQIVRLSSNIIGELTYYPIPNESFMRSYLRYQLVPVLCSLNVPACRDAANQQFRELVVNRTEVAVNNRDWVYCNGLRDGTTADYDFLWQRYRQHNTYTEKIVILQSLGCTPHTTSLNSLLSNIITNNLEISPVDFNSVLYGALIGNEGNRHIVFRYIQSHLQAFIKAFGSTSPIKSVASTLRSVAEITQFQAWATQNKAVLGDAYQGVIDSAESTRQSLQWVTTIQDDINDYFVNGDNVVSSSTVTAAAVTTLSTVTPPA